MPALLTHGALTISIAQVRTAVWVKPTEEGKGKKAKERDQSKTGYTINDTQMSYQDTESEPV